jgi:hypothetical protein
VERQHHAGESVLYLSQNALWAYIYEAKQQPASGRNLHRHDGNVGAYLHLRGYGRSEWHREQAIKSSGEFHQLSKKRPGPKPKVVTPGQIKKMEKLLRA